MPWSMTQTLKKSWAHLIGLCNRANTQAGNFAVMMTDSQRVIVPYTKIAEILKEVLISESFQVETLKKNLFTL